MLRDWQRKQLENFSHNNWQHLRPAPRTAREAFGENIEFNKPEAHFGDKVVGYGSIIIFIVCIFLAAL